VGTAPGCGGAGPPLGSYCDVRVGCGGGLAANGVGAGIAAAPGCTEGYACALSAVVLAGVYDVLVGSCAAVCGVTAVALHGVMGSSMCTGMGGMTGPCLVCS
jgi:hypothetical protein